MGLSKSDIVAPACISSYANDVAGVISEVDIRAAENELPHLLLCQMLCQKGRSWMETQAMETQAKPMLIARAKDPLFLLPAMANRHGLVAGATGTGKTVTLQVMSEQFSAIGVPVFAVDIKGDLSGISQPGVDSPKIAERVASLKLTDFKLRGSPVVFWDVFGKQGHPIRATVSEMGPLLFSRLLGLNDTQAGVLTLVFKIADDNGLLLLDLKDLQAMLQYVGANAKDFQTKYGNISAASIGAIQRGLVSLEQETSAVSLTRPTRVARWSHPTFKVVQKKADAEPSERIELSDMDFTDGFATCLNQRNGDMRGVRAGAKCTSGPQVHGRWMIAVPGAIGYGNRKTSLLPARDRLLHRTLKAPQSVETLWARSMIHKRELKVFAEPPGLADHACG
jgi:hypothetical protein